MRNIIILSILIIAGNCFGLTLRERIEAFGKSEPVASVTAEKTLTSAGAIIGNKSESIIFTAEKTLEPATEKTETEILFDELISILDELEKQGANKRLKNYVTIRLFTIICEK